jgi:hypothetical protein
MLLDSRGGHEQMLQSAVVAQGRNAGKIAFRRFGNPIHDIASGGTPRSPVR